jgi:tetratricopeptide (TPR) repeat protein
MNFVNPEFVERYQLLYEKDPTSKVFAPLGEAYRKMGLLDAAYEVCRKGVELHPHFPSGRVAFAKVMIDRGHLQEAIQQLSYAAELSPENLLAHALLGETWLKLRRPKDALRAFKMVLFLNPQDPKAIEAVQKLESLTADEYDDELFAPTQISEVASRPPEAQPIHPKPTGGPLGERMRALERYMSLADAFMVRNDLEKAIDTLNRATKELGGHPEIHSRLNLLLESEQNDLKAEMMESLPPLRPAPRAAPTHLQKRQRLEGLLQRINERRVDS